MKKLAFKNITPKVYEGLQRELNGFGVQIEGERGNISARGIKGSFDRDAANETLQIVISKTPMLLPTSMLANQITGLVERLGGEVA